MEARNEILLFLFGLLAMADGGDSDDICVE